MGRSEADRPRRLFVSARAFDALGVFRGRGPACEVHFCGIQCDEFARVGERGRKITGLTGYRHKGEECVPIRRMKFVRMFEELHRRCTSASGIQRDHVDIGVARIVGSNFCRLSQFRERARAAASEGVRTRQSRPRSFLPRLMRSGRIDGANSSHLSALANKCPASERAFTLEFTRTTQ